MDSNVITTTHEFNFNDMSCPEPLEKIFQQVEEESERRAMADNIIALERQSSLKEKNRRRASISISRFGQLTEEVSSPVYSPPATPNRLSMIAAQSSLYQSPMNNRSTGSVASAGPLHEVEEAHEEDEHHVTQIQQIAPRQTISRAVGDLLSRRTRSRSGSVLSNKDGKAGNVMIGVSVVEATINAQPHEQSSSVSVVVSSDTNNLKTRRSRLSMLAGAGLVDKAKELSNRLRSKSRPDLKATASNTPSSSTTSFT